MTETHFPTPETDSSSKKSLSKRPKRFHIALSASDKKRLLIVAVFIVLMTALFIVSIIPVQYDMPANKIASDSVYAYKTWEFKTGTERNQKKAEDEVAIKDFTITNTDAASISTNRINLLFDRFNEIRDYVSEQSSTVHETEDESDNSVQQSNETFQDSSYLSGIKKLFLENESISSAESDSEEQIKIPDFNDDQIKLIIDSDQADLDAFHDYLVSLYSETNYRLDRDDLNFFIESYTQMPDDNASGYSDGFKNLLSQFGPDILKCCTEPYQYVKNSEYEQARKAARDSAEPYIIKQGEVIVTKGKEVTEDQHKILEEMGLLTNGSNVDSTIYIGGGLLVISILLSAVFLIFIINPDISKNTSHILLTAITVLLDFVFCIIARLLNSYIAPVLMCAMILTSMVNMRCGLIMNIVMSILFASLTAGGSDSFSQQMIIIMVTNILGGTAACMIMNKGTSTRARALICIPAVAAINAVICLAFNMMTSSDLSASLEDIGFLCAGTVLSVLLFMALQPIFEGIFNLPTSTKLLELSNPNHPLMKRLMMEAPGTYHHSLMVANLAEASAESIGANTFLARVGGYYHDIGKLKRPMFFSENQAGEENAHDHTDPQVSAAILTAHPGDGVSIAKSYRLPKAIQNIIATHHGNSPVMYFYGKALQQADGKDVDISNFRYNADLPSTKESTIIMICDTVEAAVRSMKHPSPEEIDAFITKLIRGKMDDGQLADSPLTLQEIEKVRKTCVRLMTGIYHERVEYPDLPKTSVKKKPGFSDAASGYTPDKSSGLLTKKTETGSSSVVQTQIQTAGSNVKPAGSAASSGSSSFVPARPSVAVKTEGTVSGRSSEGHDTPVSIHVQPESPSSSEVKYVVPEKDKPIPIVDIPMPFIPPINLDELLKTPVSGADIKQVSPEMSDKDRSTDNIHESSEK